MKVFGKYLVFMVLTCVALSASNTKKNKDFSGLYVCTTQQDITALGDTYVDVYTLDLSANGEGLHTLVREFKNSNGKIVKIMKLEENRGDWSHSGGILTFSFIQKIDLQSFSFNVEPNSDLLREDFHLRYRKKK